MRPGNWFKSGDPWVWLIGGGLSVSLVMVVGLLALIAVRGLAHFWPGDLVEFDYRDPFGNAVTVLGEIDQVETMPAARMEEAGHVAPGGSDVVTRYLVKQGNRDQTGRDFVWYLEPRMGEFRRPGDAVMIERREWGNFYGYPAAVMENGESVATGEALWAETDARLARSNELYDRVRSLERHDIGRINHELEQARLAERRLEFSRDELTAREAAQRRAAIEARRDAANARYEELSRQREALRDALGRDSLVARMANGEEVEIPFANMVRVTRTNALSAWGKLGYYADRFVEFFTGYPREANTEGGIFPAIFGTVVMVLLMSIIVTPFGILAAIYLREYAHQGAIVRMIRVSVYNLAGVPSIVFGVFGLGFFVYAVGGTIDELFFPAKLPNPTFGTPGLMWASLTLALLTLPVVIVATEEGLARIPRSLRDGSLALGATKAETIWRVVVPLSAPAMMTGLILAIARAAGEVAPLMLVGVVKLAPNLPVDGNFPYVHLDRKIMHLGFHIYDVGFQSPNVEAARPLVYATALTLVGLIVILNLSAIGIRNRLREKYRAESE